MSLMESGDPSGAFQTTEQEPIAIMPTQHQSVEAFVGTLAVSEPETNLPLLSESGELAEVPEDSAARAVWVLGSDDLEMKKIRQLLFANGEYFIFARMQDGERPEPAIKEAYNTLMDERVLRFGTVILVETGFREQDMEVLRQSGVVISRADHHHVLGDDIKLEDVKPENWWVATIAQVARRLGIEITPEIKAIAQADQDPTAALTGKSEVPAEDMLEAKLNGIASKPGMNRDIVDAIIKSYAEEINHAPKLDVGDSQIADLRYVDVDDSEWYSPRYLCAQVAAMLNAPALVRHRGSEVLAGWPNQNIIAETTNWAVSHELEIEYVQPERGVAIFRPKHNNSDA